MDCKAAAALGLEGESNRLLKSNIARYQSDCALLILDTKGSVVRQLQTGKTTVGQTNQVNWEVGQTLVRLYITELITQQSVKAIKLLVK